MQYLPYLHEAGLKIEIFPILPREAISGYSGRFNFLKSRLKSYYKVGKRLFRERGNNTLIHIHSELFPYIPFFMEFGYLSLIGKKKYIIELDDAWFHRYDNNKSAIIRLLLGNKIRSLMHNSTLVIAGNKYIADYALDSGATHVEIIPTVVDVEKYRLFKINVHSKNTSEFLSEYISMSREPIPMVGWIGSPATTKFLQSISGAIKYLYDNKIARFVAFGADAKMVSDLPIIAVPWRNEFELEVLSQFDIGIMPLNDTLFEKGKCGYKLIQYMACSLPVVASPIGVNESIILHGETGFLASSEIEWIEYLTTLCKDAELRKKLGQSGFMRADRLYSLKVTAPRFVSLLETFSQI
jgi:glycosyltransferase involved in cell wall biosynthesis